MNRKSILLLFFVSLAFLLQAQERTISGVVTLAESNEPLIGVTVLEKGTTNGAFTDIDGKYALKITSDEAVIFKPIMNKKENKYIDEKEAINRPTLNCIDSQQKVILELLKFCNN